MAEAKTQATQASVSDFLAAVEPEGRRRDALAVCAMMTEITGDAPVMWGPSIVGFGRYRYRYDSGHQGNAARIGFSPRKAALTLYIVPAFEGRPDLVAALGPKVKTSVSCLYLKTLEDVDPAALRALCAASWTEMKRRYPTDG